jgi:hypothetical protein
MGDRIFLARPKAVSSEAAPCLLSESPQLRAILVSYFDDLWESSSSNVVFGSAGIERNNVDRIVFDRAQQIIQNTCNTVGVTVEAVVSAVEPIAKVFPGWFNGGYLAPDGRPYRRCILLPSLAFEVLIAFWNDDGAPCLAHDHGGSSGVVKMLQGAADITEYAIVEGRLGDAVRLKSLRAGECDCVSPSVVHSMRPLGPGVVTLHVYRKPMDQMTVYDPVSKEPVRVPIVSGAWL